MRIPFCAAKKAVLVAAIVAGGLSNTVPAKAQVPDDLNTIFPGHSAPPSAGGGTTASPRTTTSPPVATCCISVPQPPTYNGPPVALPPSPQPFPVFPGGVAPQ
jgi:hypothetical protein